ncbi:MAG: hypothetical protein ABSB00_03250 [Minisyncoccia bacterium]|jgi:DNA polymerase III delta subunit
MIFLFHGSDVEKTRAKAFEWVAAARTKEPNLVYVRLAREDVTPAALEDAASLGGLFVKRLLILIDDPFQEETTDILEEHIENLAASDNAIILLAPRLTTAKAKKLAARAKVVYTYDKSVAHEDTRGFNSNLVNALSAKNREKLWLEINRALMAGDAPEMLHGLLHWRARNLMEKGSRVWTSKESRRLSLALISLLQNSRRKGLDLSLSLERFALSI